MAITLVPGVHLTVLPTEKFKTVRVYMRFTTKHTALAATQRTLLTSLLETNSLNYPTQQDLSRALAELYGASFGLNVAKKGQTHQVNLLFDVVNGKYVNEPALLAESFQFLREVLFYPHIKAGKFDEATFDLEKSNLTAYLQSVTEDKQTLASLKLQELYFQADTNQAVPSFGTVHDLQTIENADLVAAYDAMMTEDQVDIFVVGDVTEAEIVPLVEQLPFAAQRRERSNMFYRQPLMSTVQEETLVEPVTQAKLHLGYQTGIYYNDQQRFALMVFNGLLGSFPHSKLFMNVREKASLAYYASSSVDTFRGFLSIQTGIDGANRARVVSLIQEQIESLQRGEVTDEELLQTKVMLKNQFLLSRDNRQALIETAYMERFLPETAMTEEQFVSRLFAVTLADIQAVARQLTLQAEFCLDGERNHE